MKKTRVAVALSGGVDSGTATALLVKKGFKCAGFHLKLWSEGNEGRFENRCCSTESLEAARKTCQKLGIPFYVIDCKEIFKKKIVDYFLKEYGRGLTPNPCPICNREIKFGKLLDYVRKLGFDYLATGHYARIGVRAHGFSPKELGATFFRSAREWQKACFGNNTLLAQWSAYTKPLGENRKCSLTADQSSSKGAPALLSDNDNFCFCLLTARDSQKDQSYFLYGLTEEKLAHILFPVGDYLKSEVRQMARKWKLPVAEKEESMAICFFPEVDYRPFLRRQIPEKIIPGKIVDIQGNVIGEHFGLPLYTIGQRAGFKLNSKLLMINSCLTPPFYVIGKDAKQNRLIVGFGRETEKMEFLVREVSWVRGIRDMGEMREIKVKVRSKGKLLVTKLQSDKDAKKVRVTLEEGERGIAPGQVAVFYREAKENLYEVLGGGIIS